MLIVAGLFCQSASAELVVFDMSDPTGTAGSAGEAFEAGASTFTMSDVTLGVNVASAFAGGDGSAAYSANSGGGGINTGGTSADGASDLDVDETLTLTWTFAATEMVTLLSMDFSGIGSDATDAAFVSINGGTAIQLNTGAADFSGGTDTWTPSGGLAIVSGDTYTFTAADQFDIADIIVDVTSAVPEPSSAICLGLFALCGVVTRRRK